MSFSIKFATTPIKNIFSSISPPVTPQTSTASSFPFPLIAWMTEMIDKNSNARSSDTKWFINANLM
jgi:hypothetical protein